MLGVLLAAAALVVSVLARRDNASPSFAGGNVSVCAKLEGDAARACYGREVGRELAAVGGAAPRTTFAAPAGTGEVTFTSVEQADPLLCDLHARVGVIDAQVPSWLGWTTSLAAVAPVS